MSEHVRVERNGEVLAITLARPERRNAITVAMYAALAEAIEARQRDSTIRLVTFRGEGQDFAAGNDLADFLSAVPRDIEEIPVWRLLRALASCETPIVAAVHGNCVGIGTTMLLHCDLVIAEDGARFSLPFVDSALVPEAASSLILPRLAGTPARRALPAAGRSVRSRRGNGDRPRQPSRSAGRARGDAGPVVDLACQAARGAAADAAAAAARHPRRNPRADEAGRRDVSPSAWRHRK